MRTNALIASMLLAAACSAERVTGTLAPTWDEDIAPLLAKKCASCHSGAAPAANWRVDSYIDTIACAAPSNAAVTVPANANALILSALSTSPHVGILDDNETATLTAWVNASAPAFSASVHTPDIIDPRAPGFHGTTLRSVLWRPMLDASDPNACGTCHDGTLSRPANITSAADGAPSCTSCHDQPGGVLACGTCHGASTHAYPPRDTCFFPNDSGGAHAAHVEPSAINSAGLACSTCHPVPGSDVISGLHGDGAVEVGFDPSRVFPEASWNPTAQNCAVSCHDRGGARPHPAWSETQPMGCNDCHSSPPANHYAGACNRCHAEANAAGTALSSGPLHMNGVVDLGDGSGKCGACHGSGDSPWPTDATHQAHENSTLSAPVACENCHVVPSSIFSPGHLDQALDVTFSDHALDRGAIPTWDGTRCQNVACHGANLADSPASPAWGDPKAAACGACHGIPPTEHTTALDCNRSICHGTETTSPPNPMITTSGLALHINGVVDYVQ